MKLVSDPLTKGDALKFQLGNKWNVSGYIQGLTTRFGVEISPGNFRVDIEFGTSGPLSLGDPHSHIDV